MVGEYYSVIPAGDQYLYHHGVQGQKWGVRRWQNPDGSLTPQGYAHYGKHPEQQTPAIREQMKRFKAQQQQSGGMRRSSSSVPNQNARVRTSEEQEAIDRRNRMIKRVAIAAGVAAVAAAGAVYLRRHPEVIKSGKQKIAEFISNKKGKKFSDGELRDMGIDVADVKKTKLDTVDIDVKKPKMDTPNVKKPKMDTPDVKKPSDTKWSFDESIENAKKAGVKDEDILDTKEKIDDYFLGDSSSGSSKPKSKPKINLTTNPDVDDSVDYTKKMKDLQEGWSNEAHKRGMSGGSGLGGKSGVLTHAEDDFERDLLKNRNKTNGGMMGHLFLKDRAENCQFCTTAYEAERRGMTGLKANRRESGGAQKTVEDWFKGAKTESLVGGTDLDDINAYSRMVEKKYGGKDPGLVFGEDAEITKKANAAWQNITKKGRNVNDEEVQSIYKKLIDQGEGARGNIQGIYGRNKNGVFTGDGGHSMAYEVHNGKLYIIDRQVGKVYKDVDGAKSALGRMCMVSATRTDGLDMTDEAKKAFTKVEGDGLISRLKGEELNDLGKTAVGTATAGSVAAIVSAMSDKSRKNVINSYKQDHPGTELTDQEILRAYAENQRKERNKS